MKRILTFCMILIFVPSLFGFSASAYENESARAEMEVEITLGGTAAMIPSVNSPVPEKTEMTLKDGEIGKFDIDFTEVGVYEYTVKMIPDDRNLNFDKTVYNIKVYVTEEKETLTATVIATADQDKHSTKRERLVFVNTVPEEEGTTVRPTEGGSEPPNDKNRNPKTEDDTKMETYFLFAMLASAGLLTLSIVYLIDTQKTLKAKKRKR